MKLIILMSGYTATGKTVAANRISDFLEKKGIKNAVIRSDIVRKQMRHKINPNYFNDNNKNGAARREAVYLKMRDMAIIELTKGNAVILDAGHNKKHMRERIYELSRRMKAHFVLVNTICEDEGEIKRRIAKRNANNPTEVANRFKVYEYSKRLSDPIENVSRIRYDTLANKITFKSNNKHIKLISRALY